VVSFDRYHNDLQDNAGKVDGGRSRENLVSSTYRRMQAKLTVVEVGKTWYEVLTGG